MNKDKTLFEGVQMSFTGTKGAFDAWFPIRILEFSRNEHLFFRNNFERLGNEITEHSLHNGIELGVIFFFKRFFIEIDGDFVHFFSRLQDEHLVALLTLANGFIECNDKCHMDVIGFGEKEEAGDVVVFDLEVVPSTMHAKVSIVECEIVSPTGCEECSLVLIEFDNGVTGSILDSGDFGNGLLQLFCWCLGFLVCWVSIWVWRDIESYSNCNCTNYKKE